MKPIGFVKCNITSRLFTKGKIYPYFEIRGPCDLGDFRIKIFDDFGDRCHFWDMFLENKQEDGHDFDFYHYPEFPQDINQWTEDDWFQYDLKYGE